LSLHLSLHLIYLFTPYHFINLITSSGGLKDFELCGYDFDILKVWYRMKRSLRQQDLAQYILKVGR
jgi:hypothetical protein